MSAQEETVSTTDTTNTPAGGAAAADANADKTAGAEGGSEQGGEQNTERDGKGRFRNPLQPRIDELTRARHDADREAAYWRARAEAAEKPKTEAEVPKKPAAADFDSYDEFVEALADWKADRKLEANDQARDERDAARRESEAAAATWSERAEEAKKRIPDFDQVMASARSVRISDGVKDYLRESERGPDLAYQLVKDPSIAEKLNAMTPARAAFALAQMEAKLEPAGAVSAEPDPEGTSAADAAKQTENAPPARKTTSAPPPVTPVRRGASTKVPLEKLSMEDYVKERRAQGARWAGRG